MIDQPEWMRLMRLIVKAMLRLNSRFTIKYNNLPRTLSVLQICVGFKKKTAERHRHFSSKIPRLKFFRREPKR